MYCCVLPLFFRSPDSTYCGSIPRAGFWTAAAVLPLRLWSPTRIQSTSGHADPLLALPVTGSAVCFVENSVWAHFLLDLSLDLPPHSMLAVPRLLLALKYSCWMRWCPSPPPSFIVSRVVLAGTLGIWFALITLVFFLELPEIGFSPAWMSCCYFCRVSSTTDPWGSQDRVCLVAWAYRGSILNA